MDHELIRVLEQLEREKGIKKQVIIEAIELAITSASRKHFGSSENIQARFNGTSGNIELFALKQVVQEVKDPNNEILLADASLIKEDIEVGQMIEVPIEQSKGFGRIAAQTAKQIIFQKLREAEREIIYSDFKGREGDLVTGIVQREERGNLIVDLGKTEALLPRNEQFLRELLKRGDRIKAYVLEVRRGGRGQQIVISRTHPGLLIKLFELEIPEIAEGIVEIKGAVREPTGRSKIAVVSHQKEVDPVGACVGMRGSRVQSIVHELRGEKIDIVQWSPDPETFVRNAMVPAKIKRIEVNQKENSMILIVDEDQLPLAIGKKGQNVRLSSKLTKWKLDVYSEAEYREKFQAGEEEIKDQTESLPEGDSDSPTVSEVDPETV
jgi:N utilization substance protein A